MKKEKIKENVKKIKGKEEKVVKKVETKKKGRKKLVNHQDKVLHEIKSGHIVVGSTNDGMPEIFSIKSKKHTDWLVGQILALKIKEVESKLGFNYKVFESMPDEIRVTEDSIGKRIVFIEDIDFDKIKGEGDDARATKAIIPDFYTVHSVNEKGITCFDEGKMRFFDFDSVFLVESDSIHKKFEEIENGDKKSKVRIKRKR